MLDAASIELMQTGSARVSDTSHYGLGWRVVAERDAELGSRMVWHAGAVPGYQAMLVLLPELDRGIVVLQKIYGVFHDAPLAATGFGASRMLAGVEPEPPSDGGSYNMLLAILVAVLTAVVGLAAWPVVNEGSLRSPDRPGPDRA